MKENNLLIELHRIIDEYIDDESRKIALKKDINQTKIKYILSELEKLRFKEFTESDKNIIKDLYYYFC